MGIAKVQTRETLDSRRRWPNALVFVFGAAIAVGALAVIGHPTLIAYVVALVVAGIVLTSRRPGADASQRLVRACGSTHVGRVRSNNEDAFLLSDLSDGRTGAESIEWEVRDEGVLLAVSDGMGGEQAGEVASAMGLEALRNHLSRDFGAGDPSIRLAAAIAHANQIVIDAGKTLEHQGMGATLAVALISANAVHVASVGDARVYVLRGTHFQQVTHDQSFVQLLIDAGTVTAEEAREQPGRNIVLQAIGKNDLLDLQIGSFAPRRGDRLLVCSDGLSGFVPAEEIEALLRRGSPKTSCADAIGAANAAGGEDNVTVIVATLDGDGYPEPRDEEIDLHRTRPVIGPQ